MMIMTTTNHAHGPAGRLEVRLTLPPTVRPGQVAVVCHPHPLFGGTMDNKVVTTTVRAYKELGLPVVSFNFRGVGASAGIHDHGRGEVDDLLAVVDWAVAQTGAQALYLAGFSFGSYIAAAAVGRLPLALKQLLLLAPPVHHYPFDQLLLPASQTLVIQGDADEVVPASQVLAWSERMQIETVRLPGCSHFFHGRLVELRQIIQSRLVE